MDSLQIVPIDQGFDGHISTHSRSYKKLSNERRRDIFETLLKQSKNGKLKKGSICATAALFSISKRTVTRIWKRAKQCHALGVPIDVSSKFHGQVGRKRVQIDFSKLENIPSECRKNLRSLAQALNVSKSLLHRRLKEGDWLSGSAGMGFTPHIITIDVGEDITTKIMSFSQQGPRAICILSGNGAISTVTLRQPSTFGGTFTYEGRFEILCLSGSYLLTENGGPRGRTGGLSISFASPDGRVVGGGVGGVLIAASSVQVMVGSFVWDSSKTNNKDVESQTADDQTAGDSDCQTVDDPVNQANLQPTQNFPSLCWH